MTARAKTLLLPPTVVFMAVLVVAISSYYVSRNSLNNEIVKLANEQMQDIEDAVLTRLNVSEEILRAGVGLFEVSQEVTPQKWQVFMTATKSVQRFPGVDGIGYTQVFRLEDSEEPENFENPMLGAGRQVSTKVPNTEKFSTDNQYTSILLIEPLDERNQKAVGFDMFAESMRREAMITARDTGEVIVSKAVNLIQDDLADDIYGFLMYAPVYKAGSSVKTVEQRREAIEGYVYGAFNGVRFTQAVLIGHDDKSLSYEIKKLGADGLVQVYQTDSYSEVFASGRSSKENRVLDNRGSEWEFNYAYYPSHILNQSDTSRPATVLLFGITSAVLITIVTFLLLRGKAHELELAHERSTNEAKDNLLSIASHQLRTPATGVKQYIGMVLQGFVGDVSPKQTVLLEKAYESNERQLKTINDVLYLARLDSGRIILNKSRVDVGALIKSVIDEQKSKIDENKHKITINMPKRRVLMEVDEHMLRMSMENLVTNAIKYTKKGGKIKVTLQRRADGRVIVAVSDNGVGIRFADRELLFKEFSRIPNELSNTVSGTGIGLYLAKHLMGLHGGDITVDSAPGEGSTFTIHLPTKEKL
jgi:signal transduction histidine kinase